MGFLLSASVGYSRDIGFDEPFLRLGNDLTLRRLRGKTRLTRTHQGIYVDGQLGAEAPLACVSCLSDYWQPLTAEISDLFVYPPPNTSDRLLEVGEDGFLDLAPLAREAFVLEIPIRALCRADCRGLCPVCGANRNEETCEHGDEQPDPRLAVLRSLVSVQET